MTPTSSSMFLASDGGSLQIYDRDGFDLIERCTDLILRTVSHEQSIRNIVLHLSRRLRRDERDRPRPRGEGVGTYRPAG